MTQLKTCFLISLLFSTDLLAGQPLCLYVSSYHAGYHWNDGIEAGLTQSLAGVCELRRYYMDTKRHQDTDFAAAKAAEVKQLIDQIHPDIVIACDDNASRYLVVPYLKDNSIPVVFCGVNWTVEPYGYPYANTTGMIEVAPIQPLVQEALRLRPQARQLVFLSADVPTQHKDAERLQMIAADNQIKLQVYLVKQFDTWKEAFAATHSDDILILGNPIGIADWDWSRASDFIQAKTHNLTASFGVAMSPYAIFSMVNVPEEQGEWSGQLAQLILAGEKPSNLPITANRRWQLFASPSRARQINLHLPERILQHAVLIDSTEQ